MGKSDLQEEVQIFFPPHKCFHTDAWVIAARRAEGIRCSREGLKTHFLTATPLRAGQSV